MTVTVHTPLCKWARKRTVTPTSTARKSKSLRTVGFLRLRQWRKHPRAEPFLNEQIRGNLQHAQTVFSEAAPKLAERLIKLGLDERVKGYTAVSAISEAFKILQTGVVDQQQREQIEAIKAQLTALEDGTPNVIDV